MPCYTPLKGYKDIKSGGLTFKKAGTAQSMEVACGQCLGCRVDRRSMWAIRIVHEAHMWDSEHGNSWVTLTYRDPSECDTRQFKAGHFIPPNYSLRPQDVTNFIRRLRRNNQQKIRYFYCGEYGTQNERPHYHLCLFNKNFSDLQKFKDKEGMVTYTSPSLEKLWPYGFSTVAELNYRTAAYTAGYILSKINGKRADEHYLRCDENGEAYWLLPEFIRMSRRPGIGASFYEKYKTDIFPADSSPVPGHGHVELVPRYYKEILSAQDPLTLALVKDLRKNYIAKHKKDFTPERLRDKYACARAKQSRQTRGL